MLPINDRIRCKQSVHFILHHVSSLVRVQWRTCRSAASATRASACITGATRSRRSRTRSRCSGRAGALSLPTSGVLCQSFTHTLTQTHTKYNIFCLMISMSNKGYTVQCTAFTYGSLRSVRYPPYTESKLGWARWLLRVPVREGSFLGRLLLGRGSPAQKPLPSAKQQQPHVDEKDIDTKQ